MLKGGVHMSSTSREHNGVLYFPGLTHERLDVSKGLRTILGVAFREMRRCMQSSTWLSGVPRRPS